MEEDSHSIKKLRKTKQCCTYIKATDGKILTNEEDTITRWKKCFQKMLNSDSDIPENITNTEEEEPIPNDDEIMTEEVVEAVHRFKTGKVAEHDRLTTKMFKKQKKGKIPEDWELEILLLIFKKKKRK
ncbi:hypothetical protein ILUMI_02308 [Ignelater luminosus]|uniref:Uncharacterized protein n=1 Tax=Ignelater luminosus TaxID=2038154 RepID=A0A8K0DP07_IGNLU|nr:hypothetical protein ILUMI_02308 [Ignelater luminosus]